MERQEVGWVGVKRGEYGEVLFWNWHVGGAVNERELEFSEEQSFSNDNIAFSTVIERTFAAVMRDTEAHGASRPTDPVGLYGCKELSNRPIE